MKRTFPGNPLMSHALDREIPRLRGVLDSRPNPVDPQRYRFGVFEIDLRTGELRKEGLKVRLQGQPFDVLAILLEKPGEVVTRDAIKARLWPKDVYVDFDQSLNKAVNRIREAVGDHHESPRFIETLPKRGYRFIAPVQPIGASPPGTLPAPGAPLAIPAVVPDRRSRRWLWFGLGLGVAAAVGLALASRLPHRRTALQQRDTVMLVVLPFQDLSGVEGQEYFSDGLTEEMIAQLGGMQPQRLGVIARTSAMQYKRTTKSAAEIARELGVDYLLEGSVRRSGERLRITAQLVRAADQTHEWAQNYERDVNDALGVQTEVARRIAEALALELLPERQAAIERRAAGSRAAADAYLKGRYQWNTRSDAGLRASLEHFHAAVSADPNYALGHAGLADAYNVMADYTLLPPTEAAPKAIAAARRALELDSGLAEAHAALAFARWNFEYDAAEADVEYKRAIQLNPAYATARHWCATYLGQLGRFEEARAQLSEARALDPLSLIVRINVAALLHDSGRHGEALDEARRVLELDPRFAVAVWLEGQALEALGRHEEAIEAFDRAADASEGNTTFLAARGRALALAGRRDEARRVLQDLVARRKHGYVSPYSLALLQAGLGDEDAAIASLEEAYRLRSNALCALRVDRRLDALRKKPAFEALIARVRFPAPRARS